MDPTIIVGIIVVAGAIGYVAYGKIKDKKESSAPTASKTTGSSSKKKTVHK